MRPGTPPGAHRRGDAASDNCSGLTRNTGMVGGRLFLSLGLGTLGSVADVVNINGAVALFAGLVPIPGVEA